MVCTNNDLTEIISSPDNPSFLIENPSMHERCLMRINDYETSARPIDFLKYLGYSILEVFLRRANGSYIPSAR